MEVCVEAGPDRLPAAVVKVWVGRRGVEEGEEEKFPFRRFFTF